MKKILIPTDLSELADYSYQLAKLIASKVNGSIDLLSIIPGPQGAIYDVGGNLMNDDGQDYSEWMHRKSKVEKKLNAWIADKPFIQSYHVKVGRVEEGIISFAEENDIDLIVMGTKGDEERGMWSKGSFTKYITNHTSIPVLSLKCDRSNISLGEVVFVSDFLENRKLNFDVLKRLQLAFDSKLTLLKIVTKDDDSDLDVMHDEMVAFAKTNDLLNTEIIIQTDESVELGIKNFADARNVDLVVLGTNQNVGISRLFSGSISDELIENLKYPMLTFSL